MKDIPKSAQRAYRSWIGGVPESWHWLDRDRFWIFVHVLHRYSKRPRSAAWLRENLRQDCPSLTDERINAYCTEYDLLCRFIAAGDDAQRSINEERFAKADNESAQLMKDYLAWKSVST
jgi:hypothetical protein